MITERAATAIVAVGLVALCLVTARVRGQIRCIGFTMAADREACFAAERRVAIEDARLAGLRATSTPTLALTEAQ